MPGSFHGITTMSSALAALQRSIDVTGSNIANVNTKGYSRQRANLAANAETPYYSNGLRWLGSGVSVTSITRARDKMLDQSAGRSSSDQGRLNSLVTGLNTIDSVYGEPSTDGISAQLTRLFDAFSALAASPTGSAQRVEARAAATSLADGISTAAQDLQNLATDTTQSAEDGFNRINELVKQISDLNGQIASAGPDSAPNQLLDQRQSALDELSGLVKIDVFEQSNGTVSVQAAGESLVEGTTYKELPDQFNPASTSFDRSQASLLRSGSLMGNIEVLDAVASQKTSLDSLANEVRSAFNSLHESGSTLSGETGIPLFAEGTGAADFAVSDQVKASADAIVAGASGKAGDGSLAQAMSDLRDAARTGLGGKSISDYYKDMVTKAASDANQAGSDLDTANAVAQQIDAQRQAVSGVSLDEEFSNMITLQRSYQAAAKALNVFDQITEDLLGIIR